jgi:PAS domain S-box-containing protein
MEANPTYQYDGRNIPERNGYFGKPVTDAISNGFFTVDQNWTVKYWNKAAEKLVGIRSEDILGKNLWRGFSKLIPSEFSQVFNHSFLKGAPNHFEEYLGKLGSWFDVIIYHCDDRVSVSFKSIVQPLKKEDLQQQLIVLNELYRFVTEVTNDCLWEWDLLTKEIFWIDGGHKRVFGYRIENALIPQSFWESRVHPEDRQRVLSGLNKIKMSKSVVDWEEEYRFKKANGEYAFVQDRGHVIYDQELGATRMIGTTQDVSSRKLIEKQLIEERLTKQKEISYAVLTAQENERLDIGRELNDNLNEVLSAAKLYIELAKTDDSQKLEYLGKSSGYIVDVIEEIRSISKKLRMPGMSMGLYDSIRFIVDKINLVHSVKIDFQANGIEEEDLNETLQLDIFRIVQELISNIIKHSGAACAMINITRKLNKITLLVSDNGQGCDLSKVKIGMGTINILSHAEQYQSSVSKLSTPGCGYEFKVVLPIDGRQKTTSHVLSDYDD